MTDLERPSGERNGSARQRGPVVLIVRDGWGRNPHPEHHDFNAIELASTPVADRLLREYPWTTIATSGEEVGLPEGTMGNSEVGHQNLGAGRVVDQESVRITKAIRDGSFFDNEALTTAVRRARDAGRAVHLMGIASDAGVHGLLEHLFACLELCRREQAERVFVHLFTDGRDTGPFTGEGYVEQVARRCDEIGVGRIASLCGRYYAMDRDNRWSRVRRAYDLLTGLGLGDSDGASDAPPHFDDPVSAVREYYEHPSSDHLKGDEFVTPRTIGADPAETRIGDGDTVVFYNYRGDRPREITRAFVLDDFHGHVAASPEDGERGFDRGPKLDLTYVTLTAYEEELGPFVEVAYPKPPKMTDIGGDYLSRLGLRQFRCAETEKFPHVTFFFNDYREEPFPGEQREMAQSPRVATYDQEPAMSAHQVKDHVLARLRDDRHDGGREDRGPDDWGPEDFFVVNFANADMVGHTGVLAAAIEAVETVDACVGELVDATLARGGALIVTADHGNAEQMWDPETGSPHTAHTTYEVDLVVVDDALRALASGDPATPSPSLRTGGRLADVFPTLLELMGLEPPGAMTGRSLLLERG